MLGSFSESQVNGGAPSLPPASALLGNDKIQQPLGIRAFENDVHKRDIAQTLAKNLPERVSLLYSVTTEIEGHAFCLWQQPNPELVPIRSREGDQIDLLEKAALARDVSAFSKAEQAIDWRGCLAEDYLRAIELALEIGAPMTARHLSEKGAQHYPKHGTLQMYARVLAPPKIVRADLPADPGVAANALWLKKHSSEYRGRWVALSKGELLNSADRFDQLIEKLSSKQGVLLTRIP